MISVRPKPFPDARARDFRRSYFFPVRAAAVGRRPLRPTSRRAGFWFPQKFFAPATSSTATKCFAPRDRGKRQSWHARNVKRLRRANPIPARKIPQSHRARGRKDGDGTERRPPDRLLEELNVFEPIGRSALRPTLRWRHRADNPHPANHALQASRDNRAAAWRGRAV